MEEGTASLEEAAQLWAKAQVVSEGPSRGGEPPARAFVERAAVAPGCHDGLVAPLSSPNQLVVAHALRASELMRSPALAEPPDEWCDRRQKVTSQRGSFRNSMGLGGYARQVRKRAGL
jgi:hypothetical protein